MKNFDKYFLMKNDDVKEFVKQKTDLFEKDSDLEVTEIGDGNLNYVLSLIHISEPTRQCCTSRMPSSA